MIAVPLKHRLAKKHSLRISDLYGETMMMVKRGDSALNDRLRDDLEQNHPGSGWKTLLSFTTSTYLTSAWKTTICF